MDQNINRRRFLGLGLTGAAALLAGPRLAWPAEGSGAARLESRPGKPTQPGQVGIHKLGLAKGRDGFLSIPKSYKPEKPVPLMVMLHGARGRTDGFNAFAVGAAAMGIAVMAPDSRGSTWDSILGGFGPDIAFLDRALRHTFARLAVDPRRVALAGFSDGASYALSAGLANGDLFSHLVAFSPGFMSPPGRQGKPAIWISHGRSDEVLPVDLSRRIVPRLKQWGYKVQYREFDGGHTVTPELGTEAFRWFVA
ncbi:MAG TPA: phospholipase [Thermoanaerobaculia bacterium]|nr:phospholipase [Thermoanaerobaculia bacterium]